MAGVGSVVAVVLVPFVLVVLVIHAFIAAVFGVATSVHGDNHGVTVSVTIGGVAGRLHDHSMKCAVPKCVTCERKNVLDHLRMRKKTVRAKNGRSVAVACRDGNHADCHGRGVVVIKC